jgi:hypothetical protein
MSDYYDWTELERRCATAKQLLNCSKSNHHVSRTAARATGGKAQLSPTESPNDVTNNASDCDEDDGNGALSSAGALLDESLLNIPLPSQSPLSAPPLTPISPPPLLMPRRRAVGTLNAAERVPPPRAHSHSCPRHQRHHHDGEGLLLPPPTTPSSPAAAVPCSGAPALQLSATVQQHTTPSAASAKGTWRSAESRKTKVAEVKSGAPQCDPCVLGRRTRASHTSHHDNSNSDNNSSSTAAPPETEAEVELLLLSLRRLDAVRAQRAAVVSRIARAAWQHKHNLRQLSELDQPTPASDVPAAPAEVQTEEEGKTENGNGDGAAVRERTVEQKQRAQLVRQLRSLDSVNDELCRRYSDLQREHQHALAKQQGRLRRHLAATSRSEPTPLQGEELHEAADSSTFDTDIRSLSPIRDASRTSRSATPLVIPLASGLVMEDADCEAELCHPCKQKHQQQQEQQLLPTWEARQAAAQWQQEKLTSSLELAMARERGRQTALAQLRPSGEVADVEGGTQAPSIQFW